MKEATLIRHNLMTVSNYTPYCGNTSCNVRNTRTMWNGYQFECDYCGWVSTLPEDFIKMYKEKWNK